MTDTIDKGLNGPFWTDEKIQCLLSRIAKLRGEAVSLLDPRKPYNGQISGIIYPYLPDEVKLFTIEIRGNLVIERLSVPSLSLFVEDYGWTPDNSTKPYGQLRHSYSASEYAKSQAEVPIDDFKHINKYKCTTPISNGGPLDPVSPIDLRAEYRMVNYANGFATIMKDDATRYKGVSRWSVQIRSLDDINRRCPEPAGVIDPIGLSNFMAMVGDEDDSKKVNPSAPKPGPVNPADVDELLAQLKPKKPPQSAYERKKPADEE